MDVSVREDLNIQTDEFEAIWIEKKNKNHKNTVIGCLYRHPHSHNLDDFIKYLTKSLSKLAKQNKDVYIAGDFNIDLLKYESNTKYSDFYNLLSSYGFLPLILQPTRITNTSQSLIDNIYTNCFDKESQSGNILIEMADHLTQFVSVSSNNFSQQDKTDYFKRDYKNWDENLFMDDLSIQNWITSDDVNTLYNDFSFRLESCINRHLPKKKLSKKEAKLKKNLGLLLPS